MKSQTAVLTSLLLVVMLLAPAAQAQPVDAPAQEEGEERTVNETDDGPPGFVSRLVDAVTPDFLADLFSRLPVPGFVKGFFGA